MYFLQYKINENVKSKIKKWEEKKRIKEKILYRCSAKKYFLIYEMTFVKIKTW